MLIGKARSFCPHSTLSFCQSFAFLDSGASGSCTLLISGGKSTPPKHADYQGEFNLSHSFPILMINAVRRKICRQEQSQYEFF